MLLQWTHWNQHSSSKIGDHTSIVCSSGHFGRVERSEPNARLGLGLPNFWHPASPWPPPHSFIDWMLRVSAFATPELCLLLLLRLSCSNHYSRNVFVPVASSPRSKRLQISASPPLPHVLTPDLQLKKWWNCAKELHNDAETDRTAPEDKMYWITWS